MTNPAIKAQSDTLVGMTYKTDKATTAAQLKAKRALKALEESKRHRGFKSKQNVNVFVDDERKKLWLSKEEEKTLALSLSSNLHPHLLMASLLEQICFLYAKEKSKANQLFKVLCNRLIELNIMAPLTNLDEMSSLRFQHRAIFDKIMRTAIQSLNQHSKSLLALPPTDPCINLNLDDEDIISQQTSRYRIEFQELCLLGKGGFGSVFKARNYLDGCEYAVKKIKFKQKNTETLIKLLREVKALANLHHTNIVGYNAAWMEYDNPFMTSKGKPIGVSTDKREQTESSSGRKNNSTSFSIEFGSDSEDSKETFLYPDNVGFAIKAKLFSSIKVEKSPPKNCHNNDSISEVIFADSTEVHISQGADLLKVPKSKFFSSYDDTSSSVNFNYSKNNCDSQLKNEIVLKSKKSHIQVEKYIKVKSNNSDHKERDQSQDFSVDFIVTPNMQNKPDSHSFSPSKMHKKIISNEKSIKNDETSLKTGAFSHSPASTIFNKAEDNLLNSFSADESCKENMKEVRHSPSCDDSEDRLNSTDKVLRRVKINDSNFKNKTTALKSVFHSKSVYEREEIIQTKKVTGNFQNSITLYIQMELCSITLQEWLQERNTHPHVEDETLRSDNMRIFYQVLKGVHFIHSQGLIHRDLKPRNIFLSGKDLHVKIGDFGLAKEDILSQGHEDILLKPSTEDGLMSVPMLSVDTHTSGVGTSWYASPEQLRGSCYDVKSDMYSLGVILFEMFHLFKTEMERLQEIEKLRKNGSCSKQFFQKWKPQADVIESLLSIVPSERPSAQDLLECQLFLSRDQIERLQEKIQQQRHELEAVKQQLKEKEKELKEKDVVLREKDKYIAQLSNKLFAVVVQPKK